MMKNAVSVSDIPTATGGSFTDLQHTSVSVNVVAFQYHEYHQESKRLRLMFTSFRKEKSIQDPTLNPKPETLHSQKPETLTNPKLSTLNRKPCTPRP